MSKTLGEQDQVRAEAGAQLVRAQEIEGLPHPTEELLHECRVHQAELEMRYEELRQNQSELEELRDLYVDTYGFLPIGHITLTHEGTISEINLTGAVLLGIDRKKLLNCHFAYFVMHQNSERWRQYFMDVVHYGKKQSCELALKRSDGSVFPARLFCPHNGAGSKTPIRIAFIDITRHKQAEEDLRIATIAFETQEGMMLTDTNGVILRVNRAFTQRTGYNAEEAVGKTPRILKSGRHDQPFYRRLWATLAGKRYWQGEIWNRHRNGNICAEWATITAVTTPDGRRDTHYVATYSNNICDSETDTSIIRNDGAGQDIPPGLLQAVEPLSVLLQQR